MQLKSSGFLNPQKPETVRGYNPSSKTYSLSASGEGIDGWSCLTVLNQRNVGLEGFEPPTNRL